MENYIPVPPDFNAVNLSKKLNEFGVYECSVENNNLVFKYGIHGTNFFEIKNILEKNSPPDKFNGFIDSIGGSWSEKIFSVSEYQAQLQDNLKKLKSIENPLKTLHTITDFVLCIKNVVGLSKPDDKNNILEALSYFFKNFPNGKVILVNRDYKFFTAHRIQSILGSMEYLSGEEIMAVVNSKEEKKAKTFEGGHFWTNRDFYLPLLCMFGKLAGFTHNHLSYELVFVLGVTVSQKPYNIAKYLYGFNSPMWGDDGNNPVIGLPPDRMVELIEWYTKIINIFLSHILNVTNFRNTDKRLKPDKQYLVVLTVDAILEIYTRMMASEEPLTRKLLFFDFIDRYMSLTGETNTYDIYKKASFDKMLERLFVSMKPKLAYDFKKGFNLVRTKFIRDTFREVSIKSRRDSNYVYLNREKTEKVEMERYVFEFMDCLRDTVHSYDLNKDKFSKYFAIHSGKVSNLLPIMSTVLMLNLISNFENIAKRYQFIRD